MPARLIVDLKESCTFTYRPTTGHSKFLVTTETAVQALEDAYTCSTYEARTDATFAVARWFSSPHDVGVLTIETPFERNEFRRLTDCVLYARYDVRGILADTHTFRRQDAATSAWQLFRQFFR